MEFTHLHVHTEYSLLDSSNKIREYVARVKELGMRSAAITDHGVMYGVAEFYKECRAQGISPILGCEIYVAPGSRFDKEKSNGQDKYYHLVLLAETQEGYQNLMRIVSIGFTEGYYYKPRVDKETLRRYSKGLIALSACLGGEVQRALGRQQYEQAREAALSYDDIFGKGNFFLELQDHGLAKQAMVNQELLRLSADTGIELVVTNDIHYTYAEDATAHDTLLCIQTQRKLAEEDRMRYPGGQYFVKSPKEMYDLFPYAAEAVANTQRIADRCRVELEFGVTKLPRFAVPEGYTAYSYLQKLCADGFEEKYAGLSDQEREVAGERLTYEMETIHGMGYVEYFLIVRDFIKYAKDNGILVGPGRGSAAGSVVSYCLDITTIDPLRYNLLFERFLNPERVTMPDIDVDFDARRRQEVIDYVVRKYGHDCVTQIITFGTMAARGVIRDVGRVMDLPYAFVDNIAKMIPMELKITIDKALEKNADLRRKYEENEEVRALIDSAKRLEGLPRHSSVHAGGVVICDRPAVEYVPLAKGADGAVTTQFTKDTLEEMGLLKMDFLGIRTLTVIRGALEQIRQKEPDFDWDGLDYRDPNVFELIGQGSTDGVFQLEQSGMKSFMMELKPQDLEDVVAGISLYRPGPMAFIPQYIRNKNDHTKIVYDCPQLEPILRETYGCIVYQEQVMRIVRELAGYSYGRSDLIRRAMAKKDPEKMKKERKAFVYGIEAEQVPGCIHNGVDEKTANKIFDEMMDFAEYAFNKSHAVVYSVVAYQTAFLKYYYPKEYMSSLMTSVMDQTSKVAEYVYSCRRMGIAILPPDINKGYGAFTVEQDGIRYGLCAIKGVGTAVIDAIVKERDSRGAFTSLENLVSRMADTKLLNKRVLESLIRSGAAEGLGGTRKQLLAVYVQLIERTNYDRRHMVSGQISLFDLGTQSETQAPIFEQKLPNVGEFPKKELLAQEKEMLGVYVSGHPMEEYEERWKKMTTATALDFRAAQEEETVGDPKEGKRVVIGGMMTDKRVIFVKDNRQMAFVTLEDLLGSVEVIVFPRQYEQYKYMLDADAQDGDVKLFVRGRISTEDGKESKLIAEQILPFDLKQKQLWLQFPSIDDYVANEAIVRGYMADAAGKDDVFVYCVREKAVKQLPRSMRVAITPELVGRLRNHYGQDRVKVVEKDIENMDYIR